MIDCLLVNMPYTDLVRPSLALGLVQGILKQEGFRVKTLYANLLLSEQMGPWFYRLTTLGGARTMIGDWSFCSLAQPGAEIDHEAYLDYFCRVLESNAIRSLDRAALKTRLLEAKAQVEEFLEGLVEDILALEPKVVGATSTFKQHLASLALLRQLKDRAPYPLVTMLGGANCEAEMGRTTHRHFPCVDYLVSGEAEELITPLIKGISAKGTGLAQEELPYGVFGPVHREEGYPASQDGGAPRAVMQDLRTLAIPDYDDYFATLETTPWIQKAVAPGLPFETSRGCWWGEKPGCRFCSLCGQARSFRSKSAEDCLSNLRDLLRRHPCRGVAIVDNILDMGYFKSLLPALAEADWAREHVFFWETRSLLTREHIKSLRRARVHFIQAGVESLHSECLRAMNKGTQGWQNIQLLKWCLIHGVRVIWHILHGIPGDKDEWYLEMAGFMPLLYHLPAPTLFTSIKIDRFSQYHLRPQEYGLDLEPLKDYEYLYPLGPEALSELANVFEDKKQSQFKFNPMASLLHGQGNDETRAAYLCWRKLWGPGEMPPVLTMEDSGRELAVVDTRPVASAAEHRLQGILREVLLSCENAPTRQRLLETMQDRGRSRGEVDSALEDLQQRRLILPLDGRILTLPTEPPLESYPQMTRYPLGIFSSRHYWQARREASGEEAGEGECAPREVPAEAVA